MVFLQKNGKLVLLALIVIALLYHLHLHHGFMNFEGISESMCGGSHVEKFCGDGCGEVGYPYPGDAHTDDRVYESFSSCYQRKQVYLNSCDPDEPSGNADVTLEKRWGKFYITINANLPYAKGGVFNTMWGSYNAFLVDTRSNKSINLGSLVRHGDRFYKLSTELLGEYSNYNEIHVYRQTEDYMPKAVLKGSITGQQCSSL